MDRYQAQLMAFDDFWDDNPDIEVLEFKTISCDYISNGNASYWSIEYQTITADKEIIDCIDSLSDLCSYELYHPTDYQCHLI